MIYVTENGVSEKMLCPDLCDDWRMQYFKDYINEMLKGDGLYSGPLRNRKLELTWYMAVTCTNPVSKYTVLNSLKGISLKYRL